METLTADQFKEKYGTIASMQFDMNEQKDQRNTSLWQEIQDIAAKHKQENQQILSQPSTDLGENIAKGTELAASNAGGVLETAGAGLSRIPVIGPAGKAIVGAIGGAAKSGFNALTDKLAGTKFFGEAAAGLPEGNRTEQALRTTSAVGQIAGDITAADAGAYGLGKTAEGASAVTSKIPKVAEDVAPPSGPSGPGGMQSMYDAAASLKSKLPGAIQELIPSTQGFINHNVARALDLTPGDINNLLQSTGNDLTWLAKNNLIGTDKMTTRGLIQKFFTDNYDAVRGEIAKVDTPYSATKVPYLTDALKQMAADTQDVMGLEATNKELTNLLKKDTVTLKDVQRVKELMDDQYSLYKVTGDVMAGRAKQGLANARQSLKGFIEKEVADATGADIKAMNNNVQTARALDDAIETRDPKGLTRANLTTRDWMMGMGLTYFGTPFLGVAAVLIKKIATNPATRLKVARYLDELSDAQKLNVSEELAKGNVPKEIEKVIQMGEPAVKPKSDLPSIEY